MSIKELNEILKKEIEWTFQHPADNLSKDFQDGFRFGLQQAIDFIEGRAEEMIEEIGGDT